MTFSDLTCVVSCLISLLVHKCSVVYTFKKTDLSPRSVVHQLKLLEKLNNSDELCGICVYLVTKQQYSSDHEPSSKGSGIIYLERMLQVSFTNGFAK